MDKFEKYNIENIPKDYLYIEKINWDDEGLKINMSFERDKGKITLLFEGTVFYYKNTAESFKPMWWINNREDYNPFYYSYDSEYIVNLKKSGTCDRLQNNTFCDCRIRQRCRCVDNRFSEGGENIINRSEHITKDKLR